MSSTQHTDTLKNVRTISTLLYWACAIAIIFQILVVPLVWYAPGWVEASTSQMTVSLADLHALSGWQKYVTMAVMMIPSLVLAYGLYRLRKMFGAFAHNAIFQPGPIRHLKAFGIALLADFAIYCQRKDYTPRRPAFAQTALTQWHAWTSLSWLTRRIVPV